MLHCNFHNHCILTRILEHDNQDPYGNEELDSDDEEAYDLEDVSSDVEMNPDELDDLESDSRLVA